MSSCVDSGNSLSGTTVGLRHNSSCTFEVLFSPTQLPSRTYTARLKVTIGRNTIRVHTEAQVVRSIG
jgi:hypothetical protein